MSDQNIKKLTSLNNYEICIFVIEVWAEYFYVKCLFPEFSIKSSFYLYKEINMCGIKSKPHTNLL